MMVPSRVLQMLALIAMMRLSSGSSVEKLVNISKTAVDTAVKAAIQSVVTVGHDAVSDLSTTLSSYCTILKYVFGENYNQIQNTTKEPDLEKLTVDCMSSNVSYVFNLTSLSKELAASGLLNKDCSMHIYMHGFLSSPEAEGFAAIKKAIQTSGANNTCSLALDASSLIDSMYLRSTEYIIFIARMVAAEMVDLVKDESLLAENIHIIGHSLGAHTAGLTAKNIESLTGQKIGRVTGLDPAGPCFNITDDFKLWKTDATFVDVIHTNAGAFGTTENLGQSNYYVNDGSIQYMCLFDTCSHSRVLPLFAESITNRFGFSAIQCDDYAAFKNGTCNDTISYMGMGATNGTQGVFYLRTNKTSPWALGKDGLSYS